MDLQPAALLQNDLLDCISRAIVANIPSSSDGASHISRCEMLDREKEELTRPLSDFNICLLNVEKDILKRYNKVIHYGYSCMVAGRPKKAQGREQEAHLYQHRALQKVK